MNLSIIFCIIVAVGLVVYMIYVRNKAKKEQQEKMDSLVPGATVTLANGLIGVVAEVGETTFTADCSPDQSGSIVEFTKEAAVKVGN